MRIIGEFTLPQATPSGNKYHKMHWAAKSRLKKSYIIQVRVLASAAGIKTAAMGDYRTVLVERHGSRELDPDNLAWGAKALLDALTITKLITDDSPKHCRVVYEQVKSTRKAEHMRIVISG